LLENISESLLKDVFAISQLPPFHELCENNIV